MIQVIRTRWALVMGLAATTVYSAFLAYPTVFSGRPIFDDEGYVLASLRSYIESGGLYSETYSQYGPGFYSLVGSLFGFLNLDLGSLGPGRWLTLVLIVLTSLASAVAVWLFTKQTLVALATNLFVAGFLLAHQVNSPLHPGHLVALILALLAVTLGSRWRPSGTPAVLGVLLTAIALIKVNVGGFALVGLAVGAALSSASLRVRVWGLAGATALPVILLSPDLAKPSVRVYLAVMLIGIGVSSGLAWVGPRVRVARVSVKRFSWWILGSAIVLVAPVILKGSTAADIVRGALIAPTGQRNAFTIPFETEFLSAPLLVAAVLVVSALWLRGRSGTSARLELAKLAGGAFSIVLLTNSPGENLMATLILAALIAIPIDRYSDHQILARRVLLMIAVLQPLHAYPVAGDQIWWGSLLLVTIAFVNVADGLPAAAFAAARVRILTRAGSAAILVALGAVVLVGVVGVAHLLPRSEYETYNGLISLGLPGSDAVRVRGDQAEIHHGVTDLLREHCDSYYSVPGLNSFYVFAEMPLVTGQNAGHWPSLLDKDAQERAVNDILQFEGRVCLLRHEPMLQFWLGQSTGAIDGPLLDFVDEFSIELGRIQDFVLLQR